MPTIINTRFDSSDPGTACILFLLVERIKQGLSLFIFQFGLSLRDAVYAFVCLTCLHHLGGVA